VVEYHGIPRAIIKGAVECFDKYQYCILLSPAPSLLVENENERRAHNCGYSFSKQHMVSQVEQLLKHHGLSGIIHLPTESNPLGNRSEQCKCLVYIGTGVGYELETIAASAVYPERLFGEHAGKLPQMVVICLKYGAKKLAEYVQTLGDAVAILWINSDFDDVSESIGILLAALTTVTNKVDSIRLNCLLPQVLPEMIDHGLLVSHGRSGGGGADAGSVFGLSESLKHTIAGNGGGRVVIPEHRIPFNNIIAGSSSIIIDSLMWEPSPDFLSNMMLAAADIEVFKELIRRSSTKIITIPPDRNHEDRHRSVMFEILKKCLSCDEMERKFHYQVVLVIDSKEKLEIVHQRASTTSSTNCNTSASASSSLLSISKVLLWCDLAECSYKEYGQIKDLATKKEAPMTVLLTLPSMLEYNKLDKDEVSHWVLPGLDNASVYSMCSSVHDEIFFDISCIEEKEEGNVYPSFQPTFKNLKKLCECLQSLLNDGIQVVAAYIVDNNNSEMMVTTIAVRVLVADVKSLKKFFGAMVMDSEVVSKLSAQLSEYVAHNTTNKKVEKISSSLSSAVQVQYDQHDHQQQQQQQQQCFLF
jgi:hypothetical protein